MAGRVLRYIYIYHISIYSNSGLVIHRYIYIYINIYHFIVSVKLYSGGYKVLVECAVVESYQCTQRSVKRHARMFLSTS